MSTAPAIENDSAFLQALEEAFSSSNKDFARAYYLFATAKLAETYNSQEIYAKYPILSEEATFHRLKRLYDQNPQHEETKRLFTSVLGTYIGSQLAALSDAFQNAKNQLKVHVADLGLRNGNGEIIESLLYEDVSEWLKKTANKPTRQALYDRMAQAYTENLSGQFIELFEKENRLLAGLGYANIIDFYSHTSGHDLKKLGENGKKLVTETQALYTRLMGQHYHAVTGLDFATEATRADISYVLHGHASPEMDAINRQFPQSKLVPLATQTFDGLGLNFSTIAQPANFENRSTYEQEVVQKTDQHDPSQPALRRILLDIANREGKRSRAYVYPAAVPAEIYLSVKPEGGLDDYSAFFHESGHAQHFAYEKPELSFAMALMGNNTTTETYAYLFQNLFMNAHWLTHMAGLPPEQAQLAVQRRALEDLYMLRRYASKMQFELALFEGVNEAGYTLSDKGGVYAGLLSLGCGFQYDAEGWTRDVDAGFYVADYFTAWSLEAQLREYLCQHFGTAKTNGEDWYANPEAGAFLKALWADGNLPQQALSARLGYHDPTDLEPLLRFMNTHLQ
ncbi:M2 family metallopeptidase [Vampirovibrio chlorellavorus]|uniref:M2 family metallopeptidase n=1 Tax=Vampirovibrio chlorellavorus TaxID=758823 RepID=UPI0026EE906B|nr:M2 family metallopeptidase [Vampirovibrio chlorellavorus]